MGIRCGVLDERERATLCVTKFYISILKHSEMVVGGEFLA